MNGRQSERSADVHEILVRGPNWLGDLVMATPGLRALRRGFPEARITLQVRPGLEPLLEGSPHVDRIWPVRSYHGGVRAFVAEAASLRRRGPFDLGVCLPDSFSSAALMRLAAVKRVVGYRRGGRAALLHQVVAPAAEWGPRRMVARERSILRLIAVLGVSAEDETTELFTTVGEQTAVRQQLASAGIESERDPLVGLAPGAGYGPAKCWPAEHFARVGDALAHAGARVLLIGAPGEAALCGAVADAMQAPSLDLAGRLDVGTLKALTQRLALLVGNDAGARHVAAALGVPCAVLMGPTSLEKTSANLVTIRVFERQDACRPCYRRDCPIDHRCLRGIEPEGVIEWALPVLEASRSPASTARLVESAS